MPHSTCDDLTILITPRPGGGPSHVLVVDCQHGRPRPDERINARVIVQPPDPDITRSVIGIEALLFQPAPAHTPTRRRRCLLAAAVVAAVIAGALTVSAHADEAPRPPPTEQQQQIQVDLLRMYRLMADLDAIMANATAEMDALATQVLALRRRCSREPQPKPDRENR